MPDSALPKHLQGRKHEDWIFPFSLIPRGWNAFRLEQPPLLIWGRKVYDITTYMYSDNKIRGGADPCQRSSWAIAITMPLHLSITFGRTGRYFRIGFRWDTIDEYYNLGVALKTIDGRVIELEKQRITYRGISRLK
jgi:hypothetical protein